MVKIATKSKILRAKLHNALGPSKYEPASLIAFRNKDDQIMDPRKNVVKPYGG